MKRSLLFIFTFIPLILIGQDLKCKDFEEGEFIGTSPLLPDVEWRIIRTKTNQLEYPSKFPQRYKDLGYPMDTIYSNIKRVGKCNYRFLYDENKMVLNQGAKDMNASGGLMVKKVKIEGKCYFYESKAILNGKEIIINGKICKIK
jgi:hypothetical protein